MKIGIADTMFARANMGKIAIDAIWKESKKQGYPVEMERYTVPGIKDLAVASKKLFDEKKCDIVVALGFVGEAEVDERCAMEAGIGLIIAELLSGKHILKVFVHSCESKNGRELGKILKDRVEKHSVNALDLLFAPQSLVEKAGTGQRQGAENAKPLSLE
ncbi:MAG: riboflavin synthase [Candidatus Diapherotrites archaeon]|nr:riboflavin synthase [Candidatus Diapherotrites archaeon]